MPELGPFGETFFEASVLAIVAALLVKSPWGGWVESVFTFATHLFDFFPRTTPFHDKKTESGTLCSRLSNYKL